MAGYPRYFYPRPPRGGRPGSFSCTAYCTEISIHALREEGDLDGLAQLVPDGLFLSTPSARRATELDCQKVLGVRISIHALREEGDGKLYCGECGRLIFLSTPSARRATRGRAGGAPPEAISIHALREEGNRALTGTSAVVSKFLSTPSARRATMVKPLFCLSLVFLSTPSARRATVRHGWSRATPKYFYPRPPQGGRHDRK